MMPILQNVLSDYFQKAEQGRLTRRPPMKRVKPFSSLRPWFIHTRPVKKISACCSVLFLECVSLLCTDLLPLSSLPSVWCGQSCVPAAHTSDFFPTLHSGDLCSRRAFLIFLLYCQKRETIEVLPSFRHGCS